MKNLIFVLSGIVGFAFALNGDLGNQHATNNMGSIDNIMYSQTYDSTSLINGYSNCGILDRWVCDDFVLDRNYYIPTDINIWMIWTGETGTTVNIVFSESDNDFDPNSAIEIWSETVSCTNYNTGETNWGYDIYQTSCVIMMDTQLEFSAGTHYFVEIQTNVVDNCFILVGSWSRFGCTWYNDGSGVWVRSDIEFGIGTDMFMDFYGYETELESCTWADVKLLF